MLPFYGESQRPESQQHARMTHRIDCDHDTFRIVFLFQCTGDTSDSSTSPSTSNEDVHLPG